MIEIDGTTFTYSLCILIVLGVILLIAMYILGKKEIIGKKGQIIGLLAGCLIILIGFLALWFI